jgi:hypothetical protein
MQTKWYVIWELIFIHIPWRWKQQAHSERR